MEGETLRREKETNQAMLLAQTDQTFLLLIDTLFGQTNGLVAALLPCRPTHR